MFFSFTKVIQTNCPFSHILQFIHQNVYIFVFFLGVSATGLKVFSHTSLECRVSTPKLSLTPITSQIFVL